MTRRRVLLLGRTPFDLDAVHATLAPGLDTDILTGATVEDVVQSFAEHQIDTVILGAGIDLDVRLEVIRHVFTASDATTVHMKDRSSGRDGMMPFVNAVLTGLAG